MKLLWAAALQDAAGGAYGYTNHAAQMKEALLSAGVDICFDEKENYDIAVHITLPNMFHPIPGKKNLLFTMCETTSLHPEYIIEEARLPTLFLVPCKFCKGVFDRYYKVPVEVCPEGIDPKLFPFHQRSAPGPDDPFRFLWVGSAGPRKGHDLASLAWLRWLRSGRMPQNCQLYIKTSGIHGPLMRYYKAALNSEASRRVNHLPPGAYFWEANKLPASIPKLPGMVVDARNLPAKELADLYRSAHAFILPSRGEAWGLTLSEALSTGLPSIWTAWAGPRDYADSSIGFPITKFKMVSLKFDGGFESYGAQPDENQIVRRFEQIYHGYDQALERGKKGSERMHSLYTWKQAAARFIEICERYV